MALRSDVAKHERQYILDMVDVADQQILEIGCGDGRMTWQYTDDARHGAIMPLITGSATFAIALLSGTERQPQRRRDAETQRRRDAEKTLKTISPQRRKEKQLLQILSSRQNRRSDSFMSGYGAAHLTRPATQNHGKGF